MLSGRNETVEISKCCTSKHVDALQYYQRKLDIAENEWESAKQSYKKENEGVVIIVFKNTDCVKECIEEFEVAKEKLLSQAKF